MPPVKDKREYALTPADRSFEIVRKFGSVYESQIQDLLAMVTNPSDQVLGAIVFLARPGHIEDIKSSVSLTNEHRERLLNAATVKDERG